MACQLPRLKSGKPKRTHLLIPPSYRFVDEEKETQLCFNEVVQQILGQESKTQWSVYYYDTSRQGACFKEPPEQIDCSFFSENAGRFWYTLMWCGWKRVGECTRMLFVYVFAVRL